MWLTGETLTSTSSLILPIVGITALITWLPQRQHTQWRIITGVTLPIVLASLASGFFRPFIPEIALTLTIICFSMWGLYHTWATQKETPTLPQHILLKSIRLGSMAGIITTLTGLGGGLLLVPLIKRGFRVPISAAIASSLVVIMMSCAMAVTSLFIHDQLTVFPPIPLMYILVGAGLSSLLIRLWKSHSSAITQQTVQKWVYSAVLVISMCGLLAHVT